MEAGIVEAVVLVGAAVAALIVYVQRSAPKVRRSEVPVRVNNRRTRR